MFSRPAQQINSNAGVQRPVSAFKDIKMVHDLQQTEILRIFFNYIRSTVPFSSSISAVLFSLPAYPVFCSGYPLGKYYSLRQNR